MEPLSELSKTLTRRGYEAEVLASGAVAVDRVHDLIRGHSVGVGSSLTLRTLRLTETMQEHASAVFLHTAGEAGASERSALTADYFLTSANAVSMDGHIVNIDGTGNRIAATCFGPQHVIYLIGRNKIVDTLDQAMTRAKDAAVKLAKHYQRKTPCVTTGKCEDCLSPQCICAVTAIHRRKPAGARMSVFLIDEDLGI
jgi:hypothetical protein